MRIHIIRTNGAEEHIDAPSNEIDELIGAPRGTCTVNLRDGRVMICDDFGYETETVDHGQGHMELRPVRALKPFNAKATSLYRKVCRPGVTHEIVGDVAIVYDAEYA